MCCDDLLSRLTASTEVAKNANPNKANALNAILFEAVALALQHGNSSMAGGEDAALMTSSVAILGRCLQVCLFRGCYGLGPGQELEIGVQTWGRFQGCSSVMCGSRLLRRGCEGSNVSGGLVKCVVGMRSESGRVYSGKHACVARYHTTLYICIS